MALLTVTFKKASYYLFLAAMGLCCCVGAFSGCSEVGMLCVWGVGPASHFCGLSFGEHSSRLQWLQLMDLVALCHVGSSQTRDCSFVPCMEGSFLSTGPPGSPIHVRHNFKGRNDGQLHLVEDTVEAQDLSNQLSSALSKERGKELTLMF